LPYASVVIDDIKQKNVYTNFDKNDLYYRSVKGPWDTKNIHVFCNIVEQMSCAQSQPCITWNVSRYLKIKATLCPIFHAYAVHPKQKVICSKVALISAKNIIQSFTESSRRYLYVCDVKNWRASNVHVTRLNKWKYQAKI